MIELRDYQSRAIHSLFGAWRDGHRSVVLALATGAGKRLMALWLMEYGARCGRRTLFVGNRRLLITQAANDARAAGMSYGTLMADFCEGDAGALAQIASLQTLLSWYEEKWSRDLAGLPPWDLLIIDEGHGSIESCQRLVDHRPAAKVLILTATPIGAAGAAIVPKPYDVIVEGAKNSELVAKGYLLPTKVIAPSEPDLTHVKLERISDEKLGRVVHKCTTFADIFKEWEPHQDRRTVVFAPGVAYGGGVVEQFNQRLGAGSFHLIEAGTSPIDRERIFDDLREGRCRGVASVGVLKEGWDEKTVTCGLDLQPNGFFRDLWQKLGRTKRTGGGYDHAVWLDMAGNVGRHGVHPDEDPEWPVGDDTSQAVADRRSASLTEPKLITCPKCKMERRGGKTCPGCGFEWESVVRWIRQGDGKLKELRAKDMVKRRLSAEERLFSKWKQRLFGALNSGLSYGQCAAVFCKETGHGPKSGWIGTFPPHSLEWKRKPASDFTFRTLADQCRHYQERFQRD